MKYITVALMATRTAKARKAAHDDAINFAWARGSFIRLSKKYGRTEAAETMLRLGYPAEMVVRVNDAIGDGYLSAVQLSQYGDIIEPK